MQKNVEKMTINYSPNFDPQKREKKKIEFLILHYTGMKNDKLAIQRLTSFNSNVSCHYYITKNGKIKSFSHKIEPNDPKIIQAIQDSINL